MRCTLLLALSPHRPAHPAEDNGLIGHWKFSGDANDASGRGNHGRAFAVDLTAAGTGGYLAARHGLMGKPLMSKYPSNPALEPRQGRFHARRLGAHGGIARRRPGRPGEQVRPGSPARA